jgi:hypothetical protein
MWKQASRFVVDVEDGEIVARGTDEQAVESNGG